MLMEMKDLFVQMNENLHCNAQKCTQENIDLSKCNRTFFYNTWVERMIN